MIYDYSKIVKNASITLSKKEKKALLIRAGIVNEKTDKVEDRYSTFYQIKAK